MRRPTGQLLLELNSLRKVVAAASTRRLHAPRPSCSISRRPTPSSSPPCPTSPTGSSTPAPPLRNGWPSARSSTSGGRPRSSRPASKTRSTRCWIGCNPSARPSATRPWSPFRRTVMEEDGMPLFMAELDDAASFLRRTRSAGGRGQRRVRRRTQGSSSSTTRAPLRADRCRGADCGSRAPSSPLPPISTACGHWPRRVDNTAVDTFVGARLHTRLTEAYAGGISWLVGADIAVAVSEAVAKMPADEADMMQRLGLLDITTLVVERHRDGDWYATDARAPVLRPAQWASWRGSPARRPWAASNSFRQTPISRPLRSVATRRRCSTNCWPSWPSRTSRRGRSCSNAAADRDRSPRRSRGHPRR